MRFGVYIKRLRKAKGLTLTKASQELGIPFQRLSDIEAGRRNVKRPPSLEMLKQIATVYEHPLAQIIENTEFYQKESSIVTHLVTEVEPLVNDMVKNSLEMIYEAKEFTPEMERAATLNYRLAQDIQLAIRLVKRRADGMASQKTTTAAMRRLGG